ncbi:unnamed protein product [Cuscuta campestris]|uniref:DUF4378 domain-containing protein n=1 Tax=Cuscuta campestris TaxID=132261 RepID=A0A484LH96_9ASTE|nr:unnamed protein product [Cuscuta campestris]
METLINRKTTRSTSSDNNGYKPQRLLKDFLNEDDYHHHPKESSKLMAPAAATSRGGCSKTAASTAISAIPRAMLGIVVRLIIPFRASSRKSVDLHEGPTARLKVKDILRWDDLTEEECDKFTVSLYHDVVYFDSMNRCTTATTSAASSGKSSWCDSNFTAGDFSASLGKIPGLGEVEKVGKENVFSCDESVGGHFREVNQMVPQLDLGYEEKEQHSPVSILDDSPFRDEDQETFSSNPILHECNNNGVRRCCYNNQECSSSYEWEIEEKREAYIRDMEMAAGGMTSWHKFEEEKDHICFHLELQVLRDLVDEALLDLFLPAKLIY